MQTDHPVLHQPVEELSASPEFKSALAKAGFKNLKEVLEFDADTLLQQKGFNYHNITELIQMLSTYRLERLLRE